MNVLNRFRIICLTVLLAVITLKAQAQVNDTVMVTVPAGSFDMGCNPNIDPICSLIPQELMHTVYLDAYRIDKYEVTYQRYQKCVDDSICTPPGVGGQFNFGWPGTDLYPVNGVTWFQAKTFCEYEGKRLPTEAEWEKAARGGDSRIYPWGNTQPNCDLAVMDTIYSGRLGCGTGNAMPIGSKPLGVSPYGAMDMAGNLWEWTNDWYDPDYYTVSPVNNPQGPSTGSYKVTKGGDFFTREGFEVRSSGKFEYYPANPSPAIGFRCAKSL